MQDDLTNHEERPKPSPRGSRFDDMWDDIERDIEAAKPEIDAAAKAMSEDVDEFFGIRKNKSRKS